MVNSNAKRFGHPNCTNAVPAEVLASCLVVWLLLHRIPGFKFVRWPMGVFDVVETKLLGLKPLFWLKLVTVSTLWDLLRSSFESLEWSGFSQLLWWSRAQLLNIQGCYKGKRYPTSAIFCSYTFQNVQEVASCMMPSALFPRHPFWTIVNAAWQTGSPDMIRFLPFCCGVLWHMCCDNSFTANMRLFISTEQPSPVARVSMVALRNGSRISSAKGPAANNGNIDINYRKGQTGFLLLQSMEHADTVPYFKGEGSSKRVFSRTLSMSSCFCFGVQPWHRSWKACYPASCELCGYRRSLCWEPMPFAFQQPSLCAPVLCLWWGRTFDEHHQQHT